MEQYFLGKPHPKFMALFGTDHAKLAMANTIKSDSIVRAMLDYGHWLINSQELRDELMVIMSIRGQMAQWAIDLREKAAKFNCEPYEIPAEMLDMRDMYTLRKRIDYTDIYSDVGSTLNRHDAQVDQLNAYMKQSGNDGTMFCIKADDDSWLPVSPPRWEVMMYKIIEANANIFDADTDPNEIIVASKCATRDDYVNLTGVRNLFKRVNEAASGWAMKDGLPIYTKHAPRLARGYATPNEWTVWLNIATDNLAKILSNPNNSRLRQFLLNPYDSGYGDFYELKIVDRSNRQDDTTHLVHYDRISAYMDISKHTPKAENREYRKAKPTQDEFTRNKRSRTGHRRNGPKQHFDRNNKRTH